MADRVWIPADGTLLEGASEAPPCPRGVAIVAGDGEHDRARETLVDRGFATLSVALLVGSEKHDARRFLDTFLVARRLQAAADAAVRRANAAWLPIGYVADGSAAAGALLASVDDPRVGAIVGRGGRPDLVEAVA